MDGLNKGKFYDAKLTRQYCDTLKQASGDYDTLAVNVFTCYENFDKEETYHGVTARCHKAFMTKSIGGMLTQLTQMQDSMIEYQSDLIENFELYVDSSREARIEYDTLETINSDFKGYFGVFLEDSNSVKTIIDNLNAEFGHYKHFPQPDSSSAFYIIVLWKRPIMV